MRKSVVIIGFLVVFFLIYFLQANFFIWFTIAGIMPNLFIIYIIFIGLYGGRNIAVAVGIIVGIFIDFFIGKTVGVTSIMLGGIGFLAGYLDRSFSKESRLTIMFIIIGGTVLYEIGLYLGNILLFKTDIEIIRFLKTVFVEIIYNTIIIIIIYPFFRETGIYVEETFKQNRILTRYF